LAVFLGPPAAFIVSLIGLVRGESRAFAVAGMTVAALTVLMIFLPAICG
jgi:hypothetical protein